MEIKLTLFPDESRFSQPDDLIHPAWSPIDQFRNAFYRLSMFRQLNDQIVPFIVVVVERDRNPEKPSFEMFLDFLDQ